MQSFRLGPPIWTTSSAVLHPERRLFKLMTVIVQDADVSRNCILGGPVENWMGHLLTERTAVVGKKNELKEKCRKKNILVTYCITKTIDEKNKGKMFNQQSSVEPDVKTVCPLQLTLRAQSMNLSCIFMIGHLMFWSFEGPKGQLC